MKIGRSVGQTDKIDVGRLTKEIRKQKKHDVMGRKEAWTLRIIPGITDTGWVLF